MRMFHLRKKVIKKFLKDKNHQKVRDHCLYIGKYRDTEHSIFQLSFNVLNEIPVVFHNSSNDDYHFVIKKLAKEFEG